ncbi:hypothetical protein MKX03_031370 [Papaver bracteatum]|nr:hypothetical protein MKX03_031370 [Papaver bracteatum]
MENVRIDGEDLETLKPRLSAIIYLTVVASIGGLVFGYYIGFIIARFGVLNDLDSILHETIRTGLVGAIVGAAAGGWANDCLGRKSSILITDASIFIGGVLHMPLLYIGDKYCLETIGNMFVALGVGMATITSPLYISEFSPTKLRDILVSINFIFYGVGKFTFLYLYDDPIRTTSYIIALAGIPALFQFHMMMSFPESPLWLYKKDRQNDAIKAMKNLSACCEVGKEFDAFRLSLRRETTNEDEISYSGGSSIFSKIRNAWSRPSVRKQFAIGTALQVVQQLVGLNALIYCIPNIIRMIGFASTDPKNDIPFMKTSLSSSFGTLSIFSGFYCTLFLVARFGKRKMLCWSLYGVLGGLLGLVIIYLVSPNATEAVSRSDSTILFKNNTCLSYITTSDEDSWDCWACLRESSGCGFCRGMHYNILGQSSGACLISESNGTSQACSAENRPWSTKYCGHNIFNLAVLLIFTIYSFSYSVSLEIIPWIMNSKMYPTEVRGIYGGTAAAANWIIFIITIISSFFLTKIGGPFFIFLVIVLFSFFGLWLIKLLDIN